MLPKVLVMMATYNGEKYVAEQIESILAQEGVDVSLLISDDGSSDQTASICRRYSRNNPSVRFKENKTNKGVTQNFMDMLYEVSPGKFDYYAFSDQDDVWLSDKMIRAVELLSSSRHLPALYYSDVINVDEDLSNPRSGHYTPLFSWEDKRYSPLIINWVLGCTMVFNSRLCELVGEYKPVKFLRYHDSWIHLIATTCGVCIPDFDKSRIWRRITSQNVVGEKDFAISGERMSRALHSVFHCDHHITETLKQLRCGYSSKMMGNRLKDVDDVIKLRDSLFKRVAMAARSDVKSFNLTETAILKCRVLLNLL